MTPHDRALELQALAQEDEQAASVLDAATLGDTVVGFHYQQAVAKLLKALLAERNVDFPMTHDLVQLRRLAQAEGHQVPVAEDDLARLAPYAAILRNEAIAGMKRLDRPRMRALVDELRTWVENQLRAESGEEQPWP